MIWKEKVIQYLDNVQVFLESQSQDLSIDSFHNRTSELIRLSKELCETISILDFKKLEDPEKTQLEVLSFKWSIENLDCAILTRDIHVKSARDSNLELSSFSPDISQVSTVQKNLKDLLYQAYSENSLTLKNILDNKLRASEDWFHQITPVKEVVVQLQDLLDQKELIQKSHLAVATVVPQINNYRNYLVETSNNRLARIRTLKSFVQQAFDVIATINEEVDHETVVQTVKSIQKISTSIENEKINSVPFESFKSEANLNNIPIYSNGGELTFKSINVEKKIESWSESELFPKMFDADSDINGLYDSSLISLFNTKNKLENLALGNQESYTFNHNQFKYALDQKLKEIKDLDQNLDKIVHELNTLVCRELQVSKIYDRESEFLPEVSFSNITKIANQRLWYESGYFNRWRTRIAKYLEQQKIPFLKGLQQDPFSFVDERQIDEGNVDVNSLFLKKGYLGRSFYVQREKEQAKLNLAFQRWNSGFQGSVLVVGKYGSGKSSFVEFVQHQYSNIKVVQLTLHNVLKVNGRRHHVSHDLSESISFLASQSIDVPCIVCIDDLERWQYGDQTIYDTVRDLIDGIAKYGKRLFFVVATNHYMHEHINRMFDFNSRFAEVIDLDVMYKQSIVDALVVRHNASLKDIDPEENVTISKKAGKIAKKSRYNIGSSMLAWERYMENGQMLEMAPPSFHQLTDRHRLILRIILTNKLISESNFRQYLTTSDNNYISEEIRKLKGFKLIERTFDGNLRVNPYIVDEVEYNLQIKTKK